MIDGHIATAMLEVLEAGVDPWKEAGGIPPVATTGRTQGFGLEKGSGPAGKHLPQGVATHVGEEDEDLAEDRVTVFGISDRESITQTYQLGELLRRMTIDGESSHLEKHRREDFYEVAQKSQIDTPLAEDHPGKSVERSLDALADDGAVALPDDDQTETLEHLDRLPNRGSVDPELGRQFALGWKPLPGREAPREDRVAQLLGDMLMDSPSGWRPEGGRRCPREVGLNRHDAMIVPLVQPIVNEKTEGRSTSNRARLGAIPGRGVRWSPRLSPRSYPGRPSPVGRAHRRDGGFSVGRVGRRPPRRGWADRS